MFGVSRMEITLDRVLQDQNEDGSWGWLPGEDGDAWATGITLFALSHFDADVPAEKVSAAQQFLVAQQTEDGSWKVPTKLSGKHKSIISSYIGTAWSVMGLARTSIDD